jgi:benzoylformate decarboxylase
MTNSSTFTDGFQTGADLVAEILDSEGVQYVFGNPGTTELPVVSALAQRPNISYVLGLQETSVVAMADGYAQASGQVGVVNLHSSGGIGHAMGALIAAQLARTPLVITAGQQDLRHLAFDPLLSGDLVELARPAMKWAREITLAEQIPVLLRRALNDSRNAPAGPVFLSLPVNIMSEQTSVRPGAQSNIRREALSTAVEELAVRLRGYSPGKLAVIVGDEVSSAGAGDVVAKLAERLGSPVFGSSWPGYIAFPTGHPLWRGTLPTQAADIRAHLSAFEAVLLLGADTIITYVYTDGPPIPPHCEVLQLSSHGGDLGRSFPSVFSCTGDILPSLTALLPLLAIDGASLFVSEARDRRTENNRELSDHLDQATAGRDLSSFVAAGQIAKAIGPHIPIIDEAPATMNFLRQFLNSKSSRQYAFGRSAILGWGMPAAVGTSLGLGRQPVVAVIGDGSAMYSPQALWTAAHEKVPVTFVIVNNRGYGILKNAVRNIANRQPSNDFVGLDLTDPDIDFQALARTFGLPGLRITRATDVADAIQAGIASNAPNVIEIVLSE